jgi:hypothetical protein
MEDTRAVSGQAVTSHRRLGTRHRRRSRASGLLRGGSGGGQPAREPCQPRTDGESVTDRNAVHLDAHRGTDRSPAGAVGQRVSDAHLGTGRRPAGAVGLPVTDRTTAHSDLGADYVSQPGADADGDADPGPDEFTPRTVALPDSRRVTLGLAGRSAALTA